VTVTTPLNHPFPQNLIEIAGSLVRPYFEADEFDDAMAAMVYLAVKRARLKGLRPHSLDLLRMIYLWLCCPFNLHEYPESYREELARARHYLFEGAAAGNYGRLDAGVPSATLLLSFAEIDAIHAQLDLDGFLRLPSPPPTPPNPPSVS